jgi:flagellar hook assembly protein FlgD
MLVKRVVADAFRAEGTHESDTWSGWNDSGITVQPGTYYCRITVRYTSGGTEEVIRKIAVIR